MSDHKFEPGDVVYVDFGKAGGKIGPAEVIGGSKTTLDTECKYHLELDIGGLGLKDDIRVITDVDEDLLILAEEAELKDIEL